MVNKTVKALFLFLLASSVFSGCRPFSAEIPDKFAASRDRGSLVIYSPDGFKARIKTEKNTPLKDTSFWAEALKTQLTGEGYPLLEERVFSSANLEGIELTWLMPLGNRYYKYMTAVSVKDKTIYIVEAAAEKELFDKYDDDIKTIISSISAR
ncbi:MAG: hypothetical protein RBT69_11075 [Spirochaetia bacterium]|nr:hypothetical protein [Spirochaetia bacterium]